MSNTTNLPAAPLAALIDRICAREGNPKQVYKRLKIHERLVFDWRNRPGYTVQFDSADRVLTATSYLWFDVWPECAEHTDPDPACASCVAYFRARKTFTGAHVPPGFGR